MWGTFSNLTQTLQDKIDEAVDDIKNSSMEEEEAAKVIRIYLFHFWVIIQTTLLIAYVIYWQAFSLIALSWLSYEMPFVKMAQLELRRRVFTALEQLWYCMILQIDGADTAYIVFPCKMLPHKTSYKSVLTMWLKHFDH